MDEKKEQSNLDRLQELMNQVPKGDRFGDLYTWMFQCNKFIDDIKAEAGEQAVRDLKNDLLNGNLLDKVNALFPPQMFITQIEVSNTH